MNDKLASLIEKITLLLIGIYFAIFGSMVRSKDKTSLILGKIIPVVFGLYIVFYVIYGGKW